MGLVADLQGRKSHQIVRQGLRVLTNLVHRGASGSDPLTGDGAGILIQLPDQLFRREFADLPQPGSYGAGAVFLPQDPSAQAHFKEILEDKILGSGQRLLGWRKVPVDDSALGEKARKRAPHIEQVLVGSTTEDTASFEQKLFVIRKWAERAAREGSETDKSFYIPSLSTKTIVYKGLLLADQLDRFYLDLGDQELVSALSIVHQRFSTNTFPTWELAQPFRLLAHNGEINTVRGNAAWMRAREQLFDGRIFGEDVRHILPTITSGMSDSACLDAVAELLMHAGRSLPHVMMMLVPEAWRNDKEMSEEKRAFYEYHSCLVEPWDGPAALAFTDGTQIGAILDRNGLRPARWTLTHDDLVVLASEAGVLNLEAKRIKRHGRLSPGKMFLIDTREGKLIEDEEIKARVAARKPYSQWIESNVVDLATLSKGQAEKEATSLTAEQLHRQQLAFGYSQDEKRLILAPMAETGQEAIGSMGNDVPLAALSRKPRLLFDYFKQHFAQVTNPAIDPIREASVMSLDNYIGGEGNLLFELPDHAQMLRLESPFLTDEEVSRLKSGKGGPFRRPAILPMHYAVREGASGLKAALDELCRLASLAVLNNHSLILLSDRGISPHRAPIPSLLATGAVHHHLRRNGTRMRIGIVVESGEVRQVHHFCLLSGYGAGAINPYLALATLDTPVRQSNYKRAIEKGLLKVMSKMGISTLQSYHGAQMFEAVGIDEELLRRYFSGTAGRLGGVDLAAIAGDCERRHREAFQRELRRNLPLGGIYQYRQQGELHLWTPKAIAHLQRAVREDNAEEYQRYADAINTQRSGPITLRSLWELTPNRKALDLSEVEEASMIVKRFATGAMSFGSISQEAHETLAIAMNRLEAKSNTGEGGERSERYQPDPNGDSRRSAIKQVASGRFGVTPHYLVNADEIQIKIAQGAKPGEGGQLPGHKVDELIAKTRHSTPGVTLISPPPHHDIYSIEDLAQLIFDLKMINPSAEISVKLVAAAGVGTVAAGVAKAGAHRIVIAGHDGGTGAAAQTSIHNAGVPWELGLAETHQVLVKNDLRNGVILQVDGQLRTGRDVAIAAMLGAEEFGFATAPLVSLGCVLMRKCHLNTCPVGIATQDKALRKNFRGLPEHVERFMLFIAEETRSILARLGFPDFRSMVGKVDCIKVLKSSEPEKWSRLNFDKLFSVQTNPQSSQLAPADDVTESFDAKLVEELKSSLRDERPFVVERKVFNVDRAIGTHLAGVITKARGEKGLPADQVTLNLQGSAGQSFGAFLVPGMALHLAGDANDYVGKGMAGGKIAVFPPEEFTFTASDNVIIGNVALYGATGGRAFFRGIAGERFAVRNSGALAVVEGVGDHGCEYMTGGRIVVIGETGKNFAAGMSGGFAYIYDERGDFENRCNTELVELTGLSVEDRSLVAELLEQHQRLTGSCRARALLRNWERSLSRFVKVSPTEYTRLLQRNVAHSIPPAFIADPLAEPYPQTGKP